MKTVRTYIILALALICLAACCSARRAALRYGDERTDVYLPLLEGKRVAVFTNHTGIIGSKDQQTGTHIVDSLADRGVDVRVIVTPEHGFRGVQDAGGHVGDSAAVIGKLAGSQREVEIHSLYRPGNYRPSAELMDKFDVLLVDIQDVGVRFYTYHITMKRLMEACAEYGKEVVVLDRPNPNGFFVDGPVLDMSLTSGVGAIPVPVAHGMTLGELATAMNGEHWLRDSLVCQLTVVPCLGYSHPDKVEIAVMPSPNLKEMAAIYAYPSTCYFEGTKVSLGRGTAHPFLVYGHPDLVYLDGDAARDTVSFTPVAMPGAMNPPCKDRLCHGFAVNDAIGKVDFGYVIDAYRRLGGCEDFFLNGRFFNLLTGRRDIMEAIKAGKSAEEIALMWKEDLEAFKRLLARKYLLYPWPELEAQYGKD